MSRISLPAQPAAATATLIPSSNSSLAGTHLTGRRLLIGRVVWAALMLLFSGSYLLAVLIYAFQLHGFQQGVYTRLTSQNAVVSGYDAIISLYLIQVGPNASLIITLLSPCWFAVSLLIYWCRSDDWMALFVALLLVMLSTNLSPALLAFSVEAGYASPLGIYITLLHLLTWSSIVFFFALFPDGRFVPGWTRWLTLVYLAWQVSLCLPTSAPFSVVHWPPLINAAFYLGIALAFGFAQLYRYLRVSSPLQRQQVKWVMFGMLMGMLVDTANLLPVLVFPVLAQASSFQVLYPILNQVLYPFVFLLIPITFGLAVLRYRLWDIDLIINRTLVYGLLTASIITLYLLVVVGLGELFSGLGNLLLSLCATGLAALGFQPLRQRLQKAVNHLMFGERDEPYQVLARLGNQLEGALATTELLPIIVQTVAQALKLPYVAITYKQQDSDTIAASSGKALDGESFICVPLVTRTELVGELL